MCKVTILLLQSQDSPSAKSIFSFCKIKILLLQNQDSPFADYKLLATLGAPAGAFLPQKNTILDLCDMSLFGKVCICLILTHFLDPILEFYKRLASLCASA